MNEVFELDIGGKVTKVQAFDLSGQRLFRVILQQKPLVIGRVSRADGRKFWTSFPEGRQQEAEAIGPLIEKYYRAKMK